MAKWLDKYEQGGLVLKQKTKDNYGKKENANEGHSTAGPGWVGEGTTNRGFNYNGAWGGTMQNGGFLQPTSSKLPEGYVIPYNTPSTELAMSIGGEKGEPAYLIPSFKGGKKLKDPIAEYKKTCGVKNVKILNSKLLAAIYVLWVSTQVPCKQTLKLAKKLLKWNQQV